MELFEIIPLKQKCCYFFNFKFLLQTTIRTIRLKAAEVLMIAKPGKPATEVSSYNSISLLSALSKLLEKLFIKQLKQIIDENLRIPIHQFGFREQHSSLDQMPISHIKTFLKGVCI